MDSVEVAAGDSEISPDKTKHGGRSSEFQELTIISKNGTVVVPPHQVGHLLTRSSYFKSLLGAGMIESTSRVIKKLNWDVVTTRQVVELLVNRAVDVNVCQMDVLLAALDEICLETVFESPLDKRKVISTKSVSSAIAKLSVTDQTTTVTFNNIRCGRLDWQKLTDVGVVSLKNGGLTCKLNDSIPMAGVPIG